MRNSVFRAFHIIFSINERNVKRDSLKDTIKEHGVFDSFRTASAMHTLKLLPLMAKVNYIQI